MRAAHAALGTVALVAVGIAGAGSFAVGCGGAADSFLDDPAPALGPDASTPTTPVDASPPPPAPVKPADAGTPKDASPAADSSPPPKPVDSGTDSSPIEPTDPGISCGTTTCDPTSQVCCLASAGHGHGGGGTPTCDTASDCANNGGISFPCVKSADCIAAGSPAGTVCCATSQQGGGPQGVSVACLPSSQCNDPSSQAAMCDPTAPDCPSGETCQQDTSTIPYPYSVCE